MSRREPLLEEVAELRGLAMSAELDSGCGLGGEVHRSDVTNESGMRKAVESGADEWLGDAQRGAQPEVLQVATMHDRVALAV